MLIDIYMGGFSLHWRSAPLRRTTFRCARQQYLAFARILRERGALELAAGFHMTARFEQQITAQTGQTMRGRKRRIVVQPVYNFKTGGRTEGQAYGHSAVQFYHWRRRELHQLPVKARDTRPIRFRGSACERARQAAISAWGV
jgi:hypothetical protein